jgi:hypothetical protein
VSGLVAQLEDARELAEKLRDALSETAAAALEAMPPPQWTVGARVEDLWHAADDLASRIDNLRTALRGT